MHFRYLINPKNQNLHIFIDSYYTAFNHKIDTNQCRNEKIEKLSPKSVIYILSKILEIGGEDKISIMFFATQFEYVPTLILIKTIGYIFSKKIQSIHLMHEPRYEKDRTSKLISLVLYCLNWSISKLADKIIIPSEEGMEKAKTFIESNKLFQINLAFKSNEKKDLLKYLQLLKFIWNSEKTFSLIGIAAPDRNPTGFLHLVHEIKKKYGDQTKFIRAGRDKDVVVNYQSEGIIMFPGYVTNIAKAYLTSQSHFVVIPYLFSTNSAVIPESLSYGKLLIVNDIPAFSYLKGKSFAFVIDFNDEIQMIECIDRIFNLSVDSYESCYLDAINFFENQHSQTYLVNRLNEVF